MESNGVGLITRFSVAHPVAAGVAQGVASATAESLVPRTTSAVKQAKNLFPHKDEKEKKKEYDEAMRLMGLDKKRYSK